MNSRKFPERWAQEIVNAKLPRRPIRYQAALTRFFNGEVSLEETVDATLREMRKSELYVGKKRTP